jgi:MFS family permease
VSIFKIRPFLVENIVLGVSNLVFIPIFFFGSEYAQISLAKSATQAGIILLYFFIGFVIASQLGGRMLDRVGAKRPVVLGCALAAVGFWLWAGQVTTLNFSDQQWYIILAGAGMGFMLSPSSTDAVNRASRLSYGEATGITQTVRNYAASLGIAVLGTILVAALRSHITTSLIALGAPSAKAHAEAAKLSQLTGGSSSGNGVSSIPHFFRLDFSYATQTVIHIMAVVMAVAAIAAFVGLRTGVQQDLAGEVTGPADGEQPTTS